MDEEYIEETQMGEEAQLLPGASPADAEGPMDANGLVQQFKTAAERSFQMYQDLERQRQAIAHEEASVQALLRCQGELQGKLQDATAAASSDLERVTAAQQELQRAQQAMLTAQGQHGSSAVRVDVLNAQLRVVDAELAASQQRVAEKGQALQRSCVERRN